MPGPKMGARPVDFDEEIVKQAPTFRRWQDLTNGQKLRYACRDFIKGHGEDEERLMRRIMIARRNNLRDHEILKRARAQDYDGSTTPTKSVSVKEEASSLSSRAEDTAKNKIKKRIKEETIEVDSQGVTPVYSDISALDNKSLMTKRKRSSLHSAFPATDEQVLQEMDIPAVEATRSYKAWLALNNENEFTYNQKYIKGREGHDWLLKKNIWRRMRYRRQNKKMIEKLKENTSTTLSKNNLTTQQVAVDDQVVALTTNASVAAAAAVVVPNIVGDVLLTGVTTEVGGTATSDTGSEDNAHAAVVEAAVAAVAASQSYVRKARESDAVDLVPSSPSRPLVPVPVVIVAEPVETVATPSVPPQSDGGRGSKHDNLAEGVGIMVHNPIITSTTATGTTTSISDRPASTPSLSDSITHTPNPLGGLNGDAFDVAAQLAAAASAAVSAAVGTETVEHSDEMEYDRAQV